MNALTPLPVSPNLKFRFDADIVGAWPAIAPRFTYDTGAVSYLPPSSSARALQLQVSQQRGAAGLENLEKQVAAHRVRSDKALLIRAAAHIKMGQPQEVSRCLTALEGNAHLAASLREAPAVPHAELMQAHFLWSVMHVAIEHGQGAALWPRLSALGLETLCIRDPERAGGLVQNAIKQGDLNTLNVLLDANLAMSSRGRTQLQACAEKLLATLTATGRNEALADADLMERVTVMQACYARAALSTEPFTPLTKALRPMLRLRPLATMRARWPFHSPNISLAPSSQSRP